MHNEAIVVGLTGQTGAGKSTVSEILISRDYPVIDADVVARRVVSKGKKCLLELALEFGIEILNVDGTLNRKKLGETVFTDKQKRIRLNQITFPYIQEEILNEVERLRQKGVPVIFLDAPTLFESGTDQYCNKVVSVIAPQTVRLERILERDPITPQEAQSRMRSQHDDAFYTQKSDFVIQNNGDLSELRVRVMEMLDFIEA